MLQKNWTFLTLMLILTLWIAFSASSCAKKKISSEPAASTAEEEARKRAEAEARQREIERQKALKEEDLRDESFGEGLADQRTMSAKSRFENEDIYFEFDSVRLAPQAQEVLNRKAQWLRANPEMTVIIEGHCDNRGTNEYNLALGEGRAQSAKGYLVDLGIESSRLNTISYGEERPLENAQTEDAWAKNRRAHFVIND
jgi:peptidoglycan-associated lipoprotein